MEFTKKSFNPLSVAQIFLFFWVFSLFFPIKYVFPSHFSYQTGLFSDFTSFSLYLSDILLTITWLWILIPRGKEFYHVVITKNPVKWLILWVMVVFLANFNQNWPLSLFFVGKTLEIIVAYGTIAVIIKETGVKYRLLSIFVALAGVQSLIAINQFFLQHPLGLFKLGEQQVYPLGWGIAKIVSYGTAYIRGYGTFPHPNLLSAFLVAGILINIYLFLKTTKLHWQALLGGLLIINILGLTATFSRAGYLALGLALAVSAVALPLLRGSTLRQQGDGVSKKPNLISVFFIILFSIILSVSLFHRFLLTRATVSDQATVERGVYNQIAVKMIKDKPIFGQGIGQSMLHMQQYLPLTNSQKKEANDRNQITSASDIIGSDNKELVWGSDIKLQPWQTQPIHNFFLLSAAELGIPGALILIWIFLFHLKLLWLKIKDYGLRIKIHHVLFAILICFLLLMFFDHYFYTLQQTQFLLWLTLGLIAAQTRPQTTDAVSFGGQAKNPQIGDSNL